MTGFGIWSLSRSKAARSKAARSKRRGQSGESKAARKPPSRTERLKLILISNNLGDSKSLISIRTTTHAKVPEEDKCGGHQAGTIRLSVGLEDTDDLIADSARRWGSRGAARYRIREI